MKDKIDHLNRIAKANEDDFKYEIIILNTHNKRDLVYQLVVEETFDDHTFLSVSSPNFSSLGDMISDDVLKNSCRFWNYKYVD